MSTQKLGSLLTRHLNYFYYTSGCVSVTFPQVGTKSSVNMPPLSWAGKHLGWEQGFWCPLAWVQSCPIQSLGCWTTLGYFSSHFASQWTRRLLSWSWASNPIWGICLPHKVVVMITESGVYKMLSVWHIVVLSKWCWIIIVIIFIIWLSLLDSMKIHVPCRRTWRKKIWPLDPYIVTISYRLFFFF